MRISSVIASIVLVGGVLAQAPSGTNSASAASSGIGKDASAALAGIDQCFIDCATKGIGAAGCNGLMDASCYCLKQSFVDDTGKCVQETCKNVDQAKLSSGIEMLKTVCMPVVDSDHQLKFPNSPSANGTTSNMTDTDKDVKDPKTASASTASVAGSASASAGVNNHTASVSANGNVSASHSKDNGATVDHAPAVQLYGAFAVFSALLLGAIAVF